MKTFFICLILLLLVSFHNLFAQEILETNPPSIKWSQVNTPNFRVIFPEEFAEEAKRVANTLEYIRIPESKTLGSKPRRISIILQNQSSISNGFVTILPRRSEFYTMPSQDYNFLGTNDWLDLLAAHEYRHIVQYQHANRGFNRVFYYLFGANTMAGMAHVAAPSWFWEGDAVVTETAFTESGRGKLPAFSLLFKTNLLEGRTFNYHKQYLRSYKHNIPDHYVLGYHMVSYLRKKTNDPDIWGKISARAWSVPFLPFAFSRAIKNKYDVNVSKLYRQVAADLRHQWQQQIDTLAITDFSRLSLKRKGYTDFSYPQVLGDGRLLVMKTGIGEIAQFVTTDDGKTVFTPGFINDSGMLSASGSTVVWNEYGFDPRWQVRNYSLIKAYDFRKKKRFVVGGKKSRYTSAAISPDETKVLAARTSTTYKTQLVVLSYPAGKVLKEFANPDNDFYSMARWSHDGNQIVSLKTNSKGRTVVIIDPETGKERELLPYSNENIGHPVLFNDYLFFNSPISGIDNIYALNTNTLERFQVTSSKYGAYNPVISKDGTTIYYNDQTKNGLDVVYIPFAPSSWKSYLNNKSDDTMYKHLVEQEDQEQIFDEVPKQNLPVTRYRKVNGIINPYTWGFYVNNDLTEGNIGVTSQDILSTTTIEAGYNFDVNERTSSLRARVSYQGLYPIIDLTAESAERSVTESIDDEDFQFKWTEQTAELGLRVPLITTSSRFASEVMIGAAAGYTKVTEFRNTYDLGGREVGGYLFNEYVGNGDLLYSKVNVSSARMLKTSRRDINSKWGQRLDVQYFDTPMGGTYDGQLFAATGVLYFPGIFKHHSLWGFGAYQNRKIETSDDNNYIFQNEIPLPRGFTVAPFNDFYTGSINYAFPLWYPDIALGPVINIQRLRTNLFYDYGYGYLPSIDYGQVYNSVGVEGKIDFNIFRFLPQLEIGVRYSRGLDPELEKIEILFGSINL